MSDATRFGMVLGRLNQSRCNSFECSSLEGTVLHGKGRK